MERLLKILYIPAGFIYSLVMYSAALNMIHYFDFPGTPFPTAKAIFWGLHLLIPASFIAVVDKMRILMQFEEDTNIINVLLESLAWIFPSSFRCFGFGAVIIVIDVILRFGIGLDFIDSTLNAWPFDMTIVRPILNPAF